MGHVASAAISYCQACLAPPKLYGPRTSWCAPLSRPSTPALPPYLPWRLQIRTHFLCVTLSYFQREIFEIYLSNIGCAFASGAVGGEGEVVTKGGICIFQYAFLSHLPPPHMHPFAFTFAFLWRWQNALLYFAFFMHFLSFFFFCFDLFFWTQHSDGIFCGLNAGQPKGKGVAREGVTPRGGYVAREGGGEGFGSSSLQCVSASWLNESESECESVYIFHFDVSVSPCLLSLSLTLSHSMHMSILCSTCHMNVARLVCVCVCLCVACADSW